MNKSTIAMKSLKLPGKNSRAITLFAAILVGIVLKYPGNAAASTSADLAISIYNTPLDVYTNDYMPYTMYVTNFGPGTVTNVVVTNTLPSGFSLISASPTYTLTGNTLTFNLGSLTNLAVQKLLVSAKPASAGSYTFSASVSSTNNTDPNTANNSASFSVNVGNYLSGSLSASLVSTQLVDLQSGLEAQFIQIVNNGSASVSSARVVVTGLTNQLWTPAGTNNGNPFVIYGSTLAPGQSGNLLLEFAPRASFTFSSSQLQAFATPLATLAPPGNLGAAIAPLSEGRESSSAVAPGAVAVFWSSVTNQSYTVLYSDNPEFANPLLSPQIVPPTGPGFNQSQWIDYGPPATVSFPTNTTPRYYRIFPNP
jgi:uncharacterized repeat protein (TIGR01451 family)